MKKIFSLLLSIQLVCLPAFAEYDFSDEAQEIFDQQQQILNNPLYGNFSNTRVKTDIKNNKNQNDERMNYTPSEAINQEIYFPVQEDLIQEVNRQQNKQLYGSVVKIPAGTKFDVTFDSGISSGSLEKNDRLTVRLTNDLIYGGKVIIPAGSLVYGTATDAKNAGYAYGSGALELNFNEILTPEGNMIPISTKKIILQAKSQRAAKMSRDVALGALGSLLLGAAFTAMGGGNDWGKNMLIYGGIGALGGGIHGAMQRGEEISIPDGTTINVTLTEPFSAAPYEL